MRTGHWIRKTLDGPLMICVCLPSIRLDLSRGAVYVPTNVNGSLRTFHRVVSSSFDDQLQRSDRVVVLYQCLISASSVPLMQIGHLVRPLMRAGLRSTHCAVLNHNR